SEVASGLGRVGGRIGVADHALEGPAEPLGALLHPLRGAVVVAAVLVGADPLEHRVHVAVELRAFDALETELALPLLAHPGPGAQAVGPVDGRAAADGKAR